MHRSFAPICTFALLRLRRPEPPSLPFSHSVESLQPYLILDVLAVTLVIALSFWRLSFWHPLTAYLFFHIYSFTVRTYDIYNGAPTIYTGSVNNYEDVTSDELSRALLLADLALIVFATTSWIAHRLFNARSHLPVSRTILNEKIIKTVAFVGLPPGLIIFFLFKATEVFEEGTGGYLAAATMWPIGITCMLIFAFGYRWYSIALLVIILGVVSVQGYHRHMVVLPLLMLSALYLQRRGRRWPTVPILLGAAALAMVFPRLKYIGWAIKQGDVQEAVRHLSGSFVKDDTLIEADYRESFLDQYACSLSMIDYNEKKYWGSTYLGVVTLPIPRDWWPDKPALNEHVKEISTSTRQFGREGRIITYLGEAYANFGYAGFVVVPAMLGYALTAFFLHATTGPWYSLSRYVYLACFMASLQLFRDGLYSLVVFTIAHNIPMLVVIILHLLPGLAQKSLDQAVDYAPSPAKPKIS